MKYAVLIEKTDTGFSAHVPDLPGCVAAGATLDETMELMRGAIQMRLAGMREDREPIPEPRTIATTLWRRNDLYRPKTSRYRPIVSIPR